MNIAFMINQRVSVSDRHPINAMFHRKSIWVEPGQILSLGDDYIAVLEVDVDAETGLQHPHLITRGQSGEQQVDDIYHGLLNLPPKGLSFLARAFEVDHNKKIERVLITFLQFSRSKLLKKGE